MSGIGPIRRWPLILSVLATVSAAACLYQCSRPGRNPVLGVVVPLTGDAGVFGRNASQGARLAVEAANRQGRLAGRQFTIVVEDSQGQPKRAVKAAIKLVDLDRACMMIGDATSVGTFAILPVIETARIPLISPSASAAGLTGISALFARTWPSDAYEATEIGRYAKNKGYRAIVALYADTDFGFDMMSAFKAVTGQSVAECVAVHSGTRDYRLVIDRARHLKADALFIALGPEDARPLFRQLLEGRLDVPVLATAFLDDPAMLSVQGVERLVFGSPVPPSPDDSARREFLEAYRARFGEDAGVFSDSGYDATMILIEAYVANKEAPDGPRIMRTVRSIRGYAGVSGKLSFEPSGDVVREYRLKTVRLGRFTWM